MKLCLATATLLCGIGIGLWSLCPGVAPVNSRFVIVTLDTLRPDHLSIYGHQCSTAVGLETFADRGVLFLNGYSTSSWTAPAVASIMTSLHPGQHGVRNGGAPGFFGGLGHHVEGQEVLADSLTTLAEVLDNHGYDTFGFATNPHISAKLGFAQGFDVFESLVPEVMDPVRGVVYSDAQAVSARVQRFADRIRASDKMLLWLHYLDPHFPYRGHPETGPAAPRPPARVTIGQDISPARSRYTALYDGEIRFVIDEMTSFLEQLQLGDDTVYIFTSDHGESFYENGHWGHTTSLHETEIRVPLLVTLPKGQATTGRVATPVNVLDIMPTVLELAGIRYEGKFEGRSLVPLLRHGDRERGNDRRVFFAELMRNRSQLQSVYEAPWKLIIDQRRDTRRLYNLEDDPGETRDRWVHEAEKGRELEGLLAGHIARTGSPKKSPTALPDEATRRQLEALGYIDGKSETAGESGP